MLHRCTHHIALTLLGALALAAPCAAEGRIIAIGDEWLLSDLAYEASPADATALALNCAEFLTGGSGSVLAYSTNVGVIGTSLANTMQGAGYTWTVGTGQPFTLATLSQYDAVYLIGTPGSGAANASILIQYVAGGGSVLVCSGTGQFGIPSNEAAAWAPFLGTYGLMFSGPWFPEPGAFPPTLEPTANPVAQGVATVMWGYGHAASAISPSDPSTDTIVGNFSAYGLPSLDVIATYNGGCPADCAADLDGSGVVDGADLGVLLGAWGTAGTAADLNCDGPVDGGDLGAMLAAWGPC